jgi:hypothetical protein
MATTIVILLPGINALCAAAQDVPKYKVFESIITNGKPYKNKFRDVTLTAVFTSPSGKKTVAGTVKGTGSAIKFTTPNTSTDWVLVLRMR